MNYGSIALKMLYVSSEVFFRWRNVEGRVA